MTSPQTAAPGTTITGLDLTYHVVTDVARSKAFFIEILGMTPTWDDPSGAEFTLADGQTFGIWKPGAGDGPMPSHCGTMFAVADAKATVDAIRARGGQISDVDETPVCFMAFGQDPDGTGFVIHQRKPEHH
jgi:predicted enzyme related to lactoylglutathione lyase